MRHPAFYAFADRTLPTVPYAGKLLALVFIGTHVPIVALLVYVLAGNGAGLAAHLDVLLVVLAATLIATAATLFGLYQLLRPVTLVADATEAYLAGGEIAPLPRQYGDTAGRLMRNVDRLLREHRRAQPRCACSHQP